MGTLEEVAAAAERYPLSTARELALALARDFDRELSGDAVRRLLRAHPERFIAEGTKQLRWRVVDQPALPEDGAPAQLPGLRPWQAAALAAWRAAGRRGVVDAVPGAGKTHLGLAAVHETLLDGGRTLIVVPGLDLQRQWFAMLRSVVPYARVVRLGAGESDDVTGADVVLAVAATARKRVLPPRTPLDLLLVDEVRTCASPRNAPALHDGYARRLGLDAVPAAKPGLPAALAEYFGGVVHTCSHAEASADQSIAPLRLAVVGVPFAAPEQERYDQLWNDFTTIAAATLGVTDLAPAATTEVVTQLANLVESGAGGSTWARRGLSAAADLRDLLSQAVAKRSVLDVLPPADGGTLVFARDVVDADAVAAHWRSQGVVAGAVHGKVPVGERSANLDDFRAKAVKVLCSAGGIEAGIDLPEADLGVVLASSRDVDHLMRRVGSVWRGKHDGRTTRVVLAYVEGTVEDPAQGGFGLHLNLLAPLADEVASFRASAAPQAVVDFLLRGGPTPAPLSAADDVDPVPMPVLAEPAPEPESAPAPVPAPAPAPAPTVTSPSLSAELDAVLADVLAVMPADSSDEPDSSARSAPAPARVALLDRPAPAEAPAAAEVEHALPVFADLPDDVSSAVEPRRYVPEPRRDEPEAAPTLPTGRVALTILPPKRRWSLFGRR